MGQKHNQALYTATEALISYNTLIKVSTLPINTTDIITSDWIPNPQQLINKIKKNPQKSVSINLALLTHICGEVPMVSSSRNARRL